MFGFVNVGERAGSGVDKIMTAWAEQNWKKPEFDFSERSDRVTLKLEVGQVVYIPGAADIRNENTNQEKATVVSKEDKILEYIRQNGSISSQKAADIGGYKSKTGARKLLDKMIEKGFLVGIDDYMVKPVELAELEMRVRALLRRTNIEMERRLIVGNLEMDADGMTATIDGEEIPVTTREFNILYKLLSYPKKTFTRAQLMDEFWGLDSGTSLRAVDVYVTKLRDKFSTCDGFEIKTVRGLGYKAVLL